MIACAFTGDIQERIQKREIIHAPRARNFAFDLVAG